MAGEFWGMVRFSQSMVGKNIFAVSREGVLFTAVVCHLNSLISEPFHFNTQTPCTPLAGAMHPPRLASLHVDSGKKVLKIILAQAISNKAHSEFMFAWFPPWSHGVGPPPVLAMDKMQCGAAATRRCDLWCHAWFVNWYSESRWSLENQSLKQTWIVDNCRCFSPMVDDILVNIGRKTIKPVVLSVESGLQSVNNMSTTLICGQGWYAWKGKLTLGWGMRSQVILMIRWYLRYGLYIYTGGQMWQMCQSNYIISFPVSASDW